VLYGPHGPVAVPGGPEYNGSCRAHPTGCWPGPSMTQLVLRADLGPFLVVPGRAHAGPNGAGLVPVHLTRAKFFWNTAS
jgi:hypothetical protein